MQYVGLITRSKTKAFTQKAKKNNVVTIVETIQEADFAILPCKDGDMILVMHALIVQVIQ